jgi:hypothetical protein
MIKKIIFILFLLCNIAYSSNAIVTPTDQSLITSDITTNDASTSKHGFAPKGTVGTTQFWRQDWTLATPSGGSGNLLWDYSVSGAAITSIDTFIDGSLTLDGNTDHDYNFQFDYIYATTSTVQITLYINNDTTAAHYGGIDGLGNVISDAIIVNALSNTSPYGATIIGTVERRGDGFCVVSYSGYLVSAAVKYKVSSGFFIKTTTETNITRLKFNSNVASSMAIGTRVQIWKRL